MSQCRCNTNKNKVDVFFFFSDEHDNTHEHLKVKHEGEVSKCRLLATLAERLMIAPVPVHCFPITFIKHRNHNNLFLVAILLRLYELERGMGLAYGNGHLPPLMPCLACCGVVDALPM